MYALDVRIRDIHTNVTLESNELKKIKSHSSSELLSVPYREDNNCEEECTYKSPD